MDRRAWLQGAAGVAVGAIGGLSPLTAMAQERAADARLPDGWPNRPIRLIVPSQAGGVYDLMGRMWADRISPLLGTIVVDNRPGGSATVGVTAAAKSPPDGYNLLLASNATHSMQPAMMTAPPYDAVNDFAVVSALAASWTAIVVSANVPVKSMAELIAYARANPGKLNFGYAGLGDTTHIAGELFKQLGGGLDIVGVPYRGMTPAIRELVSGHLQMGMPHVTAQITDLHRTGQVRMLAVNAPQRIPAAPDIPTAIEAGLADMTAATFFYLYAPTGTPRAVLDRINAATREGFQAPDFQTKLVNAGFDPMSVGDLDRTAAFAAAEHARWTPIAQKTGIKIN